MLLKHLLLASAVEAHVSIRQHTPAYLSLIRQHMSAYVSKRQHTSAYVSIPLRALDIRPDTSASSARIRPSVSSPPSLYM